MRYLALLLALLSFNASATLLTIYIDPHPYPADQTTWKVYYGQSGLSGGRPHPQTLAQSTLLLESPEHLVTVPIDWGDIFVDMTIPSSGNDATVSLLLSDDELIIGYLGRTYSPPASHLPGHLYYYARINTIPEPATWVALLVGLGCYGLAVQARNVYRRRAGHA